jgi:hypothetical protein
MNGHAYDLYKQARNRIRKVQPERLIGMAIDALHKASAEGVSAMKYFQPWNLLLLIKWVAQEADATSHRRSLPRPQDFNFLINQLHDLENAVPMASAHGHWTFFFRKLSFQQFGLQYGADVAAVARQLSLFRALPLNHRLQGEFRAISGVSINDFCIFSTAMVYLVMQSPQARFFVPEALRPLETQSEPGAIDRFLRFISKNLPELHVWLGADDFKDLPIADQRILPSPLLDAPLIVIEADHFFYYHPPLLVRSLEQSVYRNLRRSDPSRFGNDFGPLFERYVRRCLDCAQMSYLDEAALQTALTGAGECVDFLIAEDSHNVLIDAKAVEMSPLGRVSNDTDQLAKAVSAAKKAMGQGMATTLRMRGLPPGSTPAFGQGANFLIVVTYDDLFLGSPYYFSEIFADTIQQQLEDRYGNPLPIPFINIFLITIGDLEVLLQLFREGKTTLVTALRYARQQDLRMDTRKFQFSQHLKSLAAPSEHFPLVQEAITPLAEEMERRVVGSSARAAAS